MSSHPDADAFVRAILRDPADLTTRLVFADWLEETGEPPNVAWARYLRFMVEASRHPPTSFDRKKANWLASEVAVDIRVTLTIPAGLFVTRHQLLQDLLPTYHFLARLSAFTIPQTVIELVPESVARENLVLPLGEQDRTLLVAMESPRGWDTIQKLEFILNRAIVMVGAEAEQILTAIDRHYGQHEYESVDSVFYEFPVVAQPTTEQPLQPALAEVTDCARAIVLIRLVNLLLADAIRLEADRVMFVPGSSGIAVLYRVGGEWREREHLPARHWPEFAHRVAEMAGISLMGTFTDRIAAYSGAVGRISFRLDDKVGTVFTTIRLGKMNPGIDLDIPRDSGID